MKKPTTNVKQLDSLRDPAGSFTFHADESNHEVEVVASAVGYDQRKLAYLTKTLEAKGFTYALRTMGRAEPFFLSEPLIAYQYTPELGRNERIVVTVKTTLQVHKNDRQEDQRKKPDPHIFGREVARPHVYGFVAAFPLSYDHLTWSLTESEWAFSALEPYAVAVWGDKMALSGANYVKLIDLGTGEVRSCEHAWLSQAHTAGFSSDGKRLLVASAGFDAVLEFYTDSGKVAWEWFAWEHGFEQSKLGHYVVRSPVRSDALTAMGREVLLVDRPQKFDFGIPTRLCPAHLNSACYDGDGRILVSLFHQGTGIIVDKSSGETREAVSGLVNPHKLSKRKRGGYFISDTRKGKLVFIDEEYRRVREVNLRGMPGVERSPLLSEFLQNTTELKDDLFACIDIHRNTLWLIDVQQRKYRAVKFPVEWSMHDIASIGEEHQSRIGSLIGTVFGRVGASADGPKVIRHCSPSGEEIISLTLDAEGRNRELDLQM